MGARNLARSMKYDRRAEVSANFCTGRDVWKFVNGDSVFIVAIRKQAAVQEFGDIVMKLRSSELRSEGIKGHGT